MRDYLDVILALVGFAAAAMFIAFLEFNLWMWLAAMYMVCMSFCYAATFTKTMHCWMCAYSFKGGLGRTLIYTQQSKLTKKLVLDIDKHIAKDPETQNPFVQNIQYLGRVPV